MFLAKSQNSRDSLLGVISEIIRGFIVCLLMIYGDVSIAAELGFLERCEQWLKSPGKQSLSEKVKIETFKSQHQSISAWEETLFVRETVEEIRSTPLEMAAFLAKKSPEFSVLLDRFYELGYSLQDRFKGKKIKFKRRLFVFGPKRLSLPRYKPHEFYDQLLTLAAGVYLAVHPMPGFWKSFVNSMLPLETEVSPNGIPQGLNYFLEDIQIPERKKFLETFYKIAESIHSEPSLKNLEQVLSYGRVDRWIRKTAPLNEVALSEEMSLKKLLERERKILTRAYYFKSLTVSAYLAFLGLGFFDFYAADAIQRVRFELVRQNSPTEIADEINEFEAEQIRHLEDQVTRLLNLKDRSTSEDQELERKLQAVQFMRFKLGQDSLLCGE